MTRVGYGDTSLLCRKIKVRLLSTSGIRGDTEEITCVRWGTAFTPVLPAAPLWLPLALSDPGGPLRPPRPQAWEAWSITMPFRLVSLGVMHGLICHLPAATQSSSVLLFPIHPPAFSSSCHHPCRHSALSRRPLCAEHSIFCLFSVFTSHPL